MGDEDTRNRLLFWVVWGPLAFKNAWIKHLHQEQHGVEPQSLIEGEVGKVRVFQST